MRSIYDVIGLGNAIVDVIGNADELTLDLLGMVKSQMRLIDQELSTDLSACLTDPVQSAGGSAANTMMNLASLGLKAGFVGKVKDDELSQRFRSDLKSAHVQFLGSQTSSGPPTGHCLVFVTPDANRTMNTLLGASARFSTKDVDPLVIAVSQIIFLEGYLLEFSGAQAALRNAANIAHKTGRKVALSDASCVERHKDEFWNLIKDQIDILFANEPEIIALTGAFNLDGSIDIIRGNVRFAAVTRGELGSIVVAGGRFFAVPAPSVWDVVDTTGAGNAYAAGVLFGIITNRSPEECGWLGGLAAAEVISHFGARPARSLGEFVAEQRSETPSFVRHASIARQR